MAKKKQPLAPRIREYQVMNPDASAKEVAAKFKTTAGYVYALRNKDTKDAWKTVTLSTSSKPLSQTVTMIEDDLTKLTDEQLERLAHNLGKPRTRMQATSRDEKASNPYWKNHIVETPAVQSALDVQVGGAHYKDMAIQPVEFITKNNLGFLEGSIVKRICRWRAKDGLKDLEKIKHEVDLLIQLNGLK